MYVNFPPQIYKRNRMFLRKYFLWWSISRSFWSSISAQPSLLYKVKKNTLKKFWAIIWQTSAAATKSPLSVFSPTTNCFTSALLHFYCACQHPVFLFHLFAVFLFLPGSQMLFLFQIAKSNIRSFAPMQWHQQSMSCMPWGHFESQRHSWHKGSFPT